MKIFIQQFVYVMNWTFKILCLLILFSTVLLAKEGDAQVKSVRDIYVNLTLDNVSVREGFDMIEATTDLSFSYDQRLIQKLGKVSFDFDGDDTIEDFLLLLSKKFELSFRQINHTVSVKSTESKSNTQIEVIIDESIPITGKVTDENGEPLPGATVVETGTTNGTITDVDGSFSLSVPEGASLTISFVGYKPAVVNVAGQSQINIQMEADYESLEEVVVVGYGTQRKGDLTGSTSGVSSEQINKIPVNTFEQSLQGRVSGVQVTQANAAPGGGVSFKIRGTNSITGNSEPLYVIDGVPIISNNSQSTPGGLGGEGVRANDLNALSTINPSDIESIQILKDASATSIYGARGANGVVIITTKSGKSGEPTVNLDAYYGMQSTVKKVDVASPEDYVTALRESVDNGGGVLPVSEDSISSLLSSPTDWQDLIFRDPSEAIMRNIQLSVSGAANSGLSYYMSVNNFKQDGIVRRSGFERNSVRLNLEKSFNRLRTGSNFTFSRTDTDIVSAGNRISVTRYALETAPITPIYDASGAFNHQTLSGGNSANSEAILRGGSDNLISDRLLGSMFAEYEILDGLTFKTTLGVDIDNRSRDVYYDRNTGPRFGGTDSPGWANKASSKSTQVVTTNTLNYDLRISSDHHLNLTGVFEAQTFEYGATGVINRGFTSDVLGANAIASGTQAGGPTVSYSAYKWQLASWVGRAFYSFKDRYLINATIRHDGSSRFGDNNKWGTFPSVGLGWKVNQESFMQGVDLVESLKIRGSYGVTGNQEIGVLRTAERYVPTLGTMFGDLVSNGVNAESFANPNLKWEESTQFNIGTDLSLAKNRIDFTFDYYKKTTDDLLLEVNISPSSGYASPVFNAGRIENRGIEMALNTTPVISGDFEWNLGVNFSRNRNEVLKILAERTFGGEVQPQTIPGSLIQEGLPVGQFFGYKTNGVYATQDEADADLPNGSLYVKEAGEWRYVDVNGDGAINEDDRTVIGDPNPDFTYGINTSISYKNFRLDMLFQGVKGNDILWANAYNLYGQDASDLNIMQERFDNRWTPESTNAEYPKFRQGGNVVGSINDQIIFDGSFFRMKNIVLAYEFPQKALDKIKLQRLRVYASATNLFTITEYPGYNPDVNSFGQNTINAGVDQSGYPLAKSYQLGLNITF